MIDFCSVEKQPLLSVAEALQRIQHAITAVTDTETLPLTHALGRVLAEPLYAPINLPTERQSAMDGYAFASDDTSPLTVIGTSWAGKPYTGTLAKGQCVRIFTGAVMPEHADSVVMQEHVQRAGQLVHLPSNVKTKQNVRAVGEDVALGQQLLPVKCLTPVDLALLASAGILQVKVKRKINIAICSTGDELVSLGQPLHLGQIYDSNRYLLLALLQQPCYQVHDLGIIADDKDLIKQTFETASTQHDVLISTGGASVGEADYVKQVLDECGSINFWKLAIKPGKPLTFGKIKHCYFFGLPGNPISAQITFSQLVSPALQQLSGQAFIPRLQLRATCNTALKKSAGRQEYQRGIVSQSAQGELSVISAGKQGSNILSTSCIANCYIILPSDCTGVAVGDSVLIELY